MGGRVQRELSEISNSSVECTVRLFITQMEFIELNSFQHSLDINSTDGDGSSAICAKD